MQSNNKMFRDKNAKILYKLWFQIIYNKEFEGMQARMQGIIRLECPISFNQDAYQFIEYY